MESQAFNEADLFHFIVMTKPQPPVCLLRIMMFTAKLPGYYTVRFQSMSMTVLGKRCSQCKKGITTVMSGFPKWSRLFVFLFGQVGLCKISHGHENHQLSPFLIS